MSKEIKTYNDLLEEKERLEALLKLQKESVAQSARELNASFKPVYHAASFLGTMVTRDSTNPVLGTAANSIIDLVLRNIVLGRSGWIARNLIPAIVKNMSSHYIADNEDAIFNKIFKFVGIGKKKKKHKHSPEKTNGQEIIE